MSVLSVMAVGLMATIPTPSAPQCSISSQISGFDSKVLSFKGGKYDRCASLIVPQGKGKSLPVVFVGHGSGGNQKSFPKMRDQSPGETWAQVAMRHGFAVVGVEALQFSGSPSPGPAPGPGPTPGPGPAPGPTPGPAPGPTPPAPSPVTAECEDCFKSAGCTKGSSCVDCCKSHQGSCASKCMKDHVRFPDVVEAVCGEPPSNLTVSGQSSWRGGQWLIPEIQTDTTGIVCDADQPEIQYFDALIEQLKASGLDTSRLFFTGCSMGSALTVWAAQCYHKKTPSAVTAFGTQSTGLKVKGDGLNFPGDNYNPGYRWGECPDCQYFPAPVVKTEGLKACINDQTDDAEFYKSSQALDTAWKAAGMKSNATYHPGKHCQTYSFNDIVLCMDDGTGRLISA